MTKADVQRLAEHLIFPYILEGRTEDGHHVVTWRVACVDDRRRWEAATLDSFVWTIR